MKLNVIGVKRIFGESKAGNDFDMCSVLCLVPIEATKGKKVTVQGHGMEVMEVELDPAAVVQFAQVKFPAMLELATDQRPMRGELKTVCTGLVSPARMAAAS